MADLTTNSTKNARNGIAEKNMPVPMDIDTRRELIGSREYKVMLEHTRFEDLSVSLPALLFDLKRLAGKKWSDEKGFSKTDRRRVVFLDTEDGLFRSHRLILRQRKAYKKPQDGKPSATFTLKCRYEDRYIAAGQDIKPAPGRKKLEPIKFEEDIAAPFSSRFSRSLSIASGKSLPKTLADIGELFPSLARLKLNGLECSPRTEVKIVNKLVAHERVFKGPKLKFADVEATIALILWSHRWKSRPIAAELSFRYEDDSEQFQKKTASQAFEFFKKIQTLDWCSDAKSTKTQIAYGDV